MGSFNLLNIAVLLPNDDKNYRLITMIITIGCNILLKNLHIYSLCSIIKQFSQAISSFSDFKFPLYNVHDKVTQ